MASRPVWVRLSTIFHWHIMYLSIGRDCISVLARIFCEYSQAQVTARKPSADQIHLNVIAPASHMMPSNVELALQLLQLNLEGLLSAKCNICICIIRRGIKHWCHLSSPDVHWKRCSKSLHHHWVWPRAWSTPATMSKQHYQSNWLICCRCYYFAAIFGNNVAATFDFVKRTEFQRKTRSTLLPFFGNKVERCFYIVAKKRQQCRNKHWTYIRSQRWGPEKAWSLPAITNERRTKHVTCSVIKTEKLRYFLLMLVPRLTNRMRKMHTVRHHKTSSQLPRWSIKLLASCSSCNKHSIIIIIIIIILYHVTSIKIFAAHSEVTNSGALQSQSKTEYEIY